MKGGIFKETPEVAHSAIIFLSVTLPVHNFDKNVTEPLGEILIFHVLWCLFWDHV